MSELLHFRCSKHWFCCHVVHASPHGPYKFSEVHDVEIFCINGLCEGEFLQDYVLVCEISFMILTFRFIIQTRAKFVV